MNATENTAPPAEPDERHPIAVLSHLYLEIGLPLQAAAQSALADYESIFDDADSHALCAR